MKKNNIWIFVLAIFIIVIVIIGGWFWYNNYKNTDDSLTKVKQRGVLVVGSDIPYGVMEFFNEKKQPVGIDVDIAAEIASQLGVKLEFNDYDWDQIFPLVKNGKIDLAMSSITITPKRQEEMLFSDPYFNGGQVIIVLGANQEIKGISNLKDKKIAVQKDTTGYNEAKKYTSENLIISYLNFNDSNSAAADTSGNQGSNIIDDLKNGKFEAIIVDYIQALSLIKNHPDLKIVGVPFTKEDYGIATKIGNNSLIKKINSILEKMEADGTLERINTKWTTI